MDNHQLNKLSKPTFRDSQTNSRSPPHPCALFVTDTEADTSSYLSGYKSSTMTAYTDLYEPLRHPWMQQLKGTARENGE